MRLTTRDLPLLDTKASEEPRRSREGPKGDGGSGKGEDGPIPRERIDGVREEGRRDTSRTRPKEHAQASGCGEHGHGPGAARRAPDRRTQTRGLRLVEQPTALHEEFLPRDMNRAVWRAGAEVHAERATLPVHDPVKGCVATQRTTHRVRDLTLIEVNLSSLNPALNVE